MKDGTGTAFPENNRAQQDTIRPSAIYEFPLWMAAASCAADTADSQAPAGERPKILRIITALRSSYTGPAKAYDLRHCFNN
jgi:hypothetical protein